MALTPRRRILALLLLFAVPGFGCSPLTMPYFLLMGTDPKYDPDYKLCGEDSKEPTKVLVLVSLPLDSLPPELIGVDREVSAMFARKLQEAAKANKENVLIASNHTVQKFKDEHPNWQSMGLVDLGKQFKADKVIDLELNKLGIYEPGSRATLFRGHAEVSISVVDVHKPGDEPVFRKEYSTDFPRSQGPQPVTDTNLQKFRSEFLSRVATDLTWFFTAHAVSEDYPCD
jgi:hypothetical protein